MDEISNIININNNTNTILIKLNKNKKNNNKNKIEESDKKEESDKRKNVNITDNIIEDKKIKYPSCNFYLITPHYLNEKNFNKNSELLNYLIYNGFWEDFENWNTFGKKNDNKKYAGWINRG